MITGVTTAGNAIAAVALNPIHSFATNRYLRVQGSPVSTIPKRELAEWPEVESQPQVA